MNTTVKKNNKCRYISEKQKAKKRGFHISLTFQKYYCTFVMNYSMENVMNQQIFSEIQTLKRQILPDGKLILFGSQARGDAREDSDWDLLVVLNKKGKHDWDDFDKFAFPFEEIGWDYGVAINSLLYTQEEWDKGTIFPLYKNVNRDGILID